MRVTACLALLVFLVGAWGLLLIWRKRLETSRLFLTVAIWAVVLPFLMNTAGWMLTENGRQPWIVQGIQLTKNGVSPSVDVTTVAISLISFLLLYGILAVVDAVLMIRYARKELPPTPADADQDEPVPAMTY